MPLPRPLTNMHKFSNCPTPVWQISPMTEAERSEVEAILPKLEQRLVPAAPDAACRLVENAFRRDNPAALDGSSAEWIAALTAGYSEAHLKASLAACGVSDLPALAADLRRRRDNAESFRERARILLDLRPPHGWCEIPGMPPPDPPDKPFDKPVFDLCPPPAQRKAAA